MANTSTKNFPHAYGAGRCVAAFSLSHPGGPPDVTEHAQCEPPAARGEEPDYSDRLAEFPQATSVVTVDDPAAPVPTYTRRTAYVPDQQPLNATSFGVYATGSGTKRLPYRTAVAPYVPDPAPGDESVAPVAAPLLPQSEGNIRRPFGIVDDAKLGDSSAQAVFLMEADAGGFGVPAATLNMWYEVGLDWSIPDQIFRSDGTLDIGYPAPVALTGVLKWASKQAASVRLAMCRSMWVRASVATDALSEPVPGKSEYAPAAPAPPFPVATTLAMQQGSVTAMPQPRNIVTTLGVEQAAGMQAPYSTGQPLLTDALSPGQLSDYPLPNRMPILNPSVDGGEMVVRTVTVRASLDVLVTSLSLEYSNVTPAGDNTAETVATGRMSLSPVVRVWSLWDQGGGFSACRGIPRTGYAPINSLGTDFGLMPGAIEVEVIQKNSSAPDGSDDPVYDMFYEWDQLGGGGV